jgi:hypothetical protein
MGRSGQSPRSLKSNDDDVDISKNGNITQWNTPDGQRFLPSGQTVRDLTPGLYDIRVSPSVGLFFDKLAFNTESILLFPDSKSKEVLDEIKKFWDREKYFRERDGKSPMKYKRGIILHGPAGSGKTSTVALVMKDVIDRGGVVFAFSDPDTFIEGVRVFRKIQPKTKVVVLMEDIDVILQRYDESTVLNILDGVNSFEDVVFLATTNYPEKLGARIINRPSRFDKRLKIGYPSHEARKMYLEYLLTDKEIKDKDIDIDKWAEDSDGFSLAHIKELVVSVVILDNKYDDALETLRSMKEVVLSSEDDEGKKVGFSSRHSDDD